MKWGRNIFSPTCTAMNKIFISLLIIFHSLFISSKYVNGSPLSMNGIVSYVIYVVFMGLYLLSFFKFKKMNKVFVGFYMLLILYVLSYAYLSFAHNDYWFLAAAFVVLASTCGAIYSQLFKEKIDLPSRSIQKIKSIFLGPVSAICFPSRNIRNSRWNKSNVSLFFHLLCRICFFVHRSWENIEFLLLFCKYCCC